VLYSTANPRVRTTNGFTSSVKIERSVLQGESLSLKLFIDDVIDQMNALGIPGIELNKHEVHMFLFADDTVLIATTLK